MSSESKLINLDNAPFRIFDLSAMTVSEKVVLKKRLKSELSQVVSAADHIDAQVKRMLSHKFSVAADNCRSLSGNDCPSRGLKNTCEQAYVQGLCEGKEQPVDEQLSSPNKALRAAMLKSRFAAFADTILKAQQKILLSNGEKGDLAKMQQERGKLKRKLQEEGKVFSCCCSKHLEEVLEDFGVERIYEKGFYFIL